MRAFSRMHSACREGGRKALGCRKQAAAHLGRPGRAGRRQLPGANRQRRLLHSGCCGSRKPARPLHDHGLLQLLLLLLLCAALCSSICALGSCCCCRARLGQQAGQRGAGRKRCHAAAGAAGQQLLHGRRVAVRAGRPHAQVRRLQACTVARHKSKVVWLAIYFCR
jgi:hypothetical protein